MGFILFLVVFAAVCIAFLHEIKGFLKKIASVRWVQVFTPMLIVSFVWVWFDEEILMLLQHLQSGLISFSMLCVSFMPHKLTCFTARFLSLYIPASIPAWLFYWKINRGPSSSKQELRVLKLYVFSWLFFAVLVLA